MARITVSGLEDLMQDLDRLQSGTHDILEDAVKAGAGLVADKARANLNSVLSGTSTGSLADSLGITPVDTDGNGMVNAKVGFDGYDAQKTPNPLKAAVLEYGSRRQPPRPFMKPAASATRKAVKAKMQEIIEDHIKKTMKG